VLTGLALHSFSFPAKNISSTFKKLIAPLLYLVGMDVKVPGKARGVKTVMSETIAIKQQQL